MESKHQSKARPTVWSQDLIRGPTTLVQVAAPSSYGTIVISPGHVSLEQKNTAVHHVKGMRGSMNKITTTTTATEKQNNKKENTTFFPTWYSSHCFSSIYIL